MNSNNPEMIHSQAEIPATLAEIPDAEIISRVLNGEKSLYEFIMRRYNQRLYRVGISILADDTEVEDVMQVAYINAYENLAKFSHRSTFATWLTRIMINECLLRIKKRKNSYMLNLDQVESENKFQEKKVSTPESRIENRELKNILEQVISQLPEKYRTVFVLREIENLNIAETIACLEISEANVKVRLNRAKSLLRESLQKYYSKEELFHFHLSRCNRIVEGVLSKILK